MTSLFKPMGRMRASVFASLLLVLMAAPMAQAQYAGAFARIGFGARGVALSNALAADASGYASPFYNPALAPFVDRQHLAASVALMRFDRSLQYLQLAAPLRPRAGLALGVIRASVSNIDGRDSNGFHTRDYETEEYAVFLAFGLRMGERVTAGVGLQLFRADLFETVEAVNSIGVDIGLTARLTDNLRLGFVLDDLLARYSWDTSGAFGDQGKTTSDRFPTRLRFGASYTALQGRLRLLGEYESRVTSAELRTRDIDLIGDTPREVVTSERLSIQDNRLRFGAEYFLAEMFAVRGGFDSFDSPNFGAKPSAGFMVQQAVGNLLAHAEYTAVLEPYGVGIMHLIALRVYL